MWFIIGILMMLAAVAYDHGVMDVFLDPDTDYSVVFHWIFWIGFIISIGLFILLLFTIGVMAAIGVWLDR